MIIDEKREQVLTNYNAVKTVGRITESDHNVEILEMDLKFSHFQPDRIETFQFKNRESQLVFKKLTSNTNDFSSCFDNGKDFESQASQWRKVLTDYFHKAFKKVRINNKAKKKTSVINNLMDKRKKLKMKHNPEEKDEEEISDIEAKIAKECEDVNRKKVIDTFSDIGENFGNLSHQGVWKAKKKHFPKLKPSLPVAKKNLKKQLITNPEELKDLYLDTFQYRLRHRTAQPGYESHLQLQEELFKLRLELAKKKKTSPWTLSDLEDALNKLKDGKCRDPDGLIREIFKEDVIGEDLKVSMLTMFNKMKFTGIIPSFMKFINICLQG